MDISGRLPKLLEGGDMVRIMFSRGHLEFHIKYYFEGDIKRENAYRVLKQLTCIRCSIDTVNIMII